MCGIVGYVGDEEAAAFLTPALKRLEYRGYDSAGLATVNGHGLEICKCVGKVAALEAAVSAERPQGRMGIAHTRWATHGRPSDANAHPHTDCQDHVAVVHNGIVENHRELRAKLRAEGHAFTSETDTEVIAHLIERYRNGGGLPEAVRRAVADLRGSFAIACIAGDEPGVIVAARGGTSPLLVGREGGRSYLASDVPALLGTCTETHALEDGDVAVLTKDGVEINGAAGARVQRSPIVIGDAASAIDKAGYRDFMLKEIHEQPEVVRRAWHSRADAGVDFAAVSRVAVLACGSSFHAGLVAKYLIESLARIPVDVALASESRHREPLYDEHVLVVPISQSGETADTLAALKQARHYGVRSLGICNAPGSSMARDVDAVLNTCAGIEVGVAATKSFTSQLVAVTDLALRLAEVKIPARRDQFKEVAHALGRVPHLMQELLAQSDDIRRLAERFVAMESCLYLGRGLQYPLALEGALKLKELSYIHAEGLAAGEMKHGSIALIDATRPVVALAPEGPTTAAMASTIQEVKARDGQVLALATRGDQRIADLADAVIPLPPAPAWIQPLLLSVPLQLLAYHLAVLRGCDVDQPRNLAKSVTVE